MDHLSDAWNQRFSGIARLYGQDALSAFAKANICVIGIGGVGSWAAEALARTGIGKITLIDMDDVCVSNTNRQIHALQSTIGKAKIAVMEERIKAINPECQVICIDDFITPENLSEYINNDFDYVIDGIDSARPKAALIAWCRRKKIPIITVGAAGGQSDPTQIQIADLAKTIQDPLAAKVREKLKKNFNIVKNSKGKLAIECVFSTETLKYPQDDQPVCASNADSRPTVTRGMDCKTGYGASTVVTASFAFVAVSRVLKRLGSAKRKFTP